MEPEITKDDFADILFPTKSPDIEVSPQQHRLFSIELTFCNYWPSNFYSMFKNSGTSCIEWIQFSFLTRLKLPETSTLFKTLVSSKLNIAFKNLCYQQFLLGNIKDPIDCLHKLLPQKHYYKKIELKKKYKKQLIFFMIYLVDRMAKKSDMNWIKFWWKRR